MADTKIQGFAFGENWQDFLRILSDEHILEAEKALGALRGHPDLHGKLFLDIGSGSGLPSLHSFDYDPQSVACTRELKRCYFLNDPAWTIRQGSILDREFMDQLGTFDICHAWGMLHHTGALWQALENAQRPVRPEGLLFVAIYNDQGLISAMWRSVKRFYCSGRLGRALMSLIFYPVFFLSGLALDLVGVWLTVK